MPLPAQGCPPAKQAGASPRVSLFEHLRHFSLFLKTLGRVLSIFARPQLVPAVEKKAGETAQGEKRKVGEVSNDASEPQRSHEALYSRLYMPPHKKKRGLELAEWKEIKAQKVFIELNRTQSRKGFDLMGRFVMQSAGV